MRTLLALAIVLGAACQPAKEVEEPEEVATVPPVGPRVEKAIADARATIKNFIGEFKNQKGKDIQMWAQFPAEPEGFDRLWLAKVTYDGKQFQGHGAGPGFALSEEADRRRCCESKSRGFVRLVRFRRQGSARQLCKVQRIQGEADRSIGSQ